MIKRTKKIGKRLVKLSQAYTGRKDGKTVKNGIVLLKGAIKFINAMDYYYYYLINNDRLNVQCLS